MIKLRFTTKYEQLNDSLPNYKIIRLRTLISIKDEFNRWKKVEDAIIDTGAHTSVLPMKFWQDAKREKITDYSMKGINPDDMCAIPIEVSNISIILLDYFGNQTKELMIKCFLAKTNKVPAIIGFADLLEKYKICFDYEKKEAFLEESKNKEKNSNYY